MSQLYNFETKLEKKAQTERRQWLWILLLWGCFCTSKAQVSGPPHLESMTSTTPLTSTTVSWQCRGPDKGPEQDLGSRLHAHASRLAEQLEQPHQGLHTNVIAFTAILPYIHTWATYTLLLLLFLPLMFHLILLLYASTLPPPPVFLPAIKHGVRLPQKKITLS